MQDDQDVFEGNHDGNGPYDDRQGLDNIVVARGVYKG